MPKSNPSRAQAPSKPLWSLQEGFKPRPKKGFDFGSHFKALLVDFGSPRGGAERQNGCQNRFKNGLGFKAVFPPPEALQEHILTPSGLDFGASGS